MTQILCFDGEQQTVCSLTLNNLVLNSHCSKAKALTIGLVIDYELINSVPR